ncbi:hypothetical protein D7003_06300 [Arthrobacter oryzae]|uniref:Uncharacterized protein n=1 Tax=Arthrobacter oryzae TaxID=409290 RepID=A0A3N0C564_9MICC|nr:hypothetical protein D7003_06300 [Arthrobacter oryzae]
MPGPPWGADTGSGATGSGHGEDSRKPRRVPQKTLVGGGSSSTTPSAPTGSPSSTPTSSTPSSGPTSSPPPARLCAGSERPDLTNNECGMLTSAVDSGGGGRRRLHPDYGAWSGGHGLVCTPPADSGFSST